MESVKRRWYNMSLRKALVCYVTAAAVLALALCAITSNLCDFLVKEIYEAYPETVEKYYLTNERGERLGYGGGYYDRWLEHFSGVTVGLCREAVLQDRVPDEAHDAIVDILLTERESLSL